MFWCYVSEQLFILCGTHYSTALVQKRRKVKRIHRADYNWRDAESGSWGTHERTYLGDEKVPYLLDFEDFHVVAALKFDVSLCESNISNLRLLVLYKVKRLANPSFTYEVKWREYQESVDVFFLKGCVFVLLLELRSCQHRYFSECELTAPFLNIHSCFSQIQTTSRPMER